MRARQTGGAATDDGHGLTALCGALEQLGAGLEEELFRPLGERRADFYAELPIEIRLRGNYHELGEFASGIAALPRIVTQHNVSIRPKGKESKKLVMETTAKTYRYIDEDENVQTKKKNQKGKHRKRKKR